MHVLVQIVKQLVRLCSYVFRFEKNLNYVSKSLTCAFNSVLELVNSCVSGKISRIVPGYVRTIFDRGHLQYRLFGRCCATTEHLNELYLRDRHPPSLWEEYTFRSRVGTNDVRNVRKWLGESEQGLLIGDFLCLQQSNGPNFRAVRLFSACERSTRKQAGKSRTGWFLVGVPATFHVHPH